MLARAVRYANTVSCFWKEAQGFTSFARLMQIRLAQSKIGGLVCPTPITARVAVESLGGHVHLRSHTTDISVLMELLVSNGYDCTLPFVSRTPETIVDLGANTGLALRWMLARWPAARVVAVEPEAQNAAILRRNLDDSPGSATVFEACIGDRPRQARLAGGDGEWGFRMEEPTSTDDELVDVIDMTTVLSELGGNGIDLLKCDIEGAEVELFESCGEWIEKVGVAVVECHDDYTGEDLLGAVAKHAPDFRLTYSTGKSPWGCEIVVLARE